MGVCGCKGAKRYILQSSSKSTQQNTPNTESTENSECFQPPQLQEMAAETEPAPPPPTDEPWGEPFTPKASQGSGSPPVVMAGRIRRSRFILDLPGNIHQAYDIEKNKLGSGTYGSVRKARSKATGSVRAVKSINKSQTRYVEWVRAEGKIMKTMDHPNILKLFETFEDQKNVYLVLELCTGGCLADRLVDGGYFTEVQAAVLMRQILRTTSYMHKKCICHRDLKPENFLFSSNDPVERSVLKIIDFGVSTIFDPRRMMSTKAGTPYYTAPQVLDGRYDESCDNWSCGVIMYVLLCGQPPFMGKTDVEVWQKIRRGNFAFQAKAWEKVSDDAKNLIRGLLKFNPSERYDANQALNHNCILQKAPRGKDVRIRSSVVSSLKSFCSQSHLKKAALYAIAMHMKEEQIDGLREIFLALDTDDDGFITVKEIQEALSAAGIAAPDNLEAIVHKVDVDGSGSIDYTEFLAANLGESAYMQKEACRAAFQTFDRDRDGRITQAELEEALGDPDATTAPATNGKSKVVVDLLREADTNGDGVLDFQEFMAMMKRGRLRTSDSGK
mmetsp:Transcript_39460/g.69400  ORF Transcript_39460/g.69400 Transcript_39460/m.69400 type:complete len:557 (+) Transcript_39460:51-1721(+)